MATCFPDPRERLPSCSTLILGNHMSELEAPAFPNPTVGKLWGSRTPPGAVLTGLEWQTRRLRGAPRTRGNCPHMSRFRGMYNGEGGIRTPDTFARIPVFETGAFNRSATSPGGPRKLSAIGGRGGLAGSFR